MKRKKKQGIKTDLSLNIKLSFFEKSLDSCFAQFFFMCNLVSKAAKHPCKIN